MNRSHGLYIKKPVSIWLKEIDVDFKELFKNLGKVLLNAKFGKLDRSINSLVDVFGNFTIKDDPGSLVWQIIYRSISRAMMMLIEDNIFIIREATKGFQSLIGEQNLSEDNFKIIAETLDYSVQARDIAIEDSFFTNPKSFPILEDLKDPFSQWLVNLGLTAVQSDSISDRLNSYFVFALNEEWKEFPNEYEIINQAFSTPFLKAAKNEQEWQYYYSFLHKKIDEPLFGEAFSLGQIYIPLRAYFHEKDENVRDKINKIVVDAATELESWVNNNENNDSIRIISGGPGYGKSSVAKIFAVEQTKNSNRRVLFVPLHLFEPANDLFEALSKFILEEGIFSSTNFLDPKNGEKNLLIIFDGLDELSMQGAVGNEVAQQFIKHVQRKVDIINQHEPRLKVLICGRDISVEAGAVNLDRKAKIIHLLPYLVDKKIMSTFTDHSGLLTKDQRDDWWIKYGKVTGKEYFGMPAELSRETLDEITSLPLLNYLVALSLTRGKLTFDQNINLNAIYQDLLQSVFQRENIWADKQHTILEGISEDEFFRILEEIALTSWHSGDARRITVNEIQNQCENSGLSQLLEKFQSKSKSKESVSSLLVAFYFKKSGIQAETLNETFEFTHKSFSEYLTARRLVRGLKRIVSEIKRRQESYESGWDENEAIKHLIKITGPARTDTYMINFINREIALEFSKNSNEVHEWQKALALLFKYVIKHGIPMEKFDDQHLIFKAMRIYAKNTSLALLAMLNACFLSTDKISDVEFKTSQDLRLWLNDYQDYLVPRLISALPLDELDLGNLDLTHSILRRTRLTYTIFSQSEIRGSDFTAAYLVNCNFDQSILTGSHFVSAQIFDTSFDSANLHNANMSQVISVRCSFEGANLSNAFMEASNFDASEFSNAYMREINLNNSSLEKTDLQKANLYNAKLIRTNFTLSLLRSANLEHAILEDAVMVEADLENANLNSTVLYNVDFRNANLFCASLCSSNLYNANLQKANLEGANFYKADLSNANLKDARITGANFLDAILNNVIWINGKRILNDSPICNLEELIFEG